MARAKAKFRGVDKRISEPRLLDKQTGAGRFGTQHTSDLLALVTGKDQTPKRRQGTDIDATMCIGHNWIQHLCLFSTIQFACVSLQVRTWLKLS